MSATKMLVRGLAGSLPLLLPGCGWWGNAELPCEKLLTCSTLTDGGPDVAIGVDVSASDATHEDREDGAEQDHATNSDRYIGDSASEDAALDGSADSNSDVADVGAADAGCDFAGSPDKSPASVTEACGVFVAPGVAGLGDGSRARPLRSIAAAIQRATLEQKRVYVCDNGTGYSEQLVIGNTTFGLQIFGGFECDGWTYSTTRRARVSAPASPALSLSKVTSGMLIADLEVDAPSGATAGASSVAVIINESAGVVLRNVTAVAGKGRDGAAGEHGAQGDESAPVGLQGHYGANACVGTASLGGEPANTLCNGTAVSTGGKGGDGASSGAAKGGNGDDGSPTAASGRGGSGEPTSGTWDCGTGQGQAGANGADGADGARALGRGSLNAQGWVGISGGDGKAGVPGQGGGGGGGARTPSMCTGGDGGLLPLTGASGGSGGGGGCGGAAGRGGGAGGSSIAIISLNSDVTLVACELVVDDAGRGGNGGKGQRGGNGGAPGMGGSGFGSGATGSKNACDGGRGGSGGSGGSGAGGAGGHSIGVAYRGAAVVGTEAASVKVGAPGGGGIAGDALAGTGDDGVAMTSMSFSGTDGGV